MSAIMNYAVEYYNLPKNPAKKSMGKKQAENMQFWTLNEFQTFIKTTEDDMTVNTIFNLFFFSGIREGELLALTLNDFDFDKNTVSITKTYARVKGKDVIQPPKTKKSNRVVSLPSDIMSKVKEYSTHLYGYKPKYRLFSYTKGNLHRWMTKYCEKSGVKRIRIHDLRHSHASLLVEKNVPIKAISERLGHEDVQTTLNTYSHLYPQKQEEIANLLSAFTI
jgi:integrase